MTSKPPIVPSRNALRALRRLALHGSTVIGAVGSISGVALVSYDVQQRVRLAERLIENKRTLSSISNTNRASHMAKMFELAEKGEYHGLETSRQALRQRVRKGSSLAVKQVEDDAVAMGWVAEGEFSSRQEMDSLCEQQPALRKIISDITNRKKRTAHNLMSPETTAPRSMRRMRPLQSPQQAHSQFFVRNEEYKWPQGAIRGIPPAVIEARGLGISPPRNSAAAQKIIEATQKQHKVTSYAVHGRPKTSKGGQPARLARCVDLWLSPNVGTDDNTAQATEQINVDQNCMEPAGERRDLEQRGQTASSESITPSLSGRAPSLITPDSIPSSGNITSAECSILETHNLTTSPRAAHLEIPSLPTGKQDQEGGVGAIPVDVSIITDPSFREWPGLEARSPGNNQPSQAESTSQLQIQDAMSTEVGRAQVVSSPKGNTSAKEDLDVSRELEGLISRYTEVLQNRSMWLKSTNALSAFTVSSDDAFDISQNLGNMLSGSVLPSANSAEDQSLNTPRNDICPTESTGFEFASVNQKQRHFDLHFRLIEAIETVLSKQGRHLACQLALESMEVYLRGAAPENNQAANSLFQKFDGVLQFSRESRAVQLLVRFLLSTEDGADYERAAIMLFPPGDNLNANGITGSNVLLTRATRKAAAYLTTFSADEGSDHKVILEFRKILQAAKDRGLGQSEALFAPVLRHLLSSGNFQRLEHFFKEMVSHHQIEATSLTRTILLTGFASAHDWVRVKKEFEAMHHKGVSRKEPLGYALMFNHVFLEYAASEPIGKTHDFLVNAMAYWGLVPTSQISATAIQAYLTHGRYDLVHEWVEAVRVLFPQINIGSNAFVLNLAETWDQLQATCEEIENACQSIVRGLDGVVSHSFKYAVHEAVSRHLARKLHAANPAQRSSEAVDGQIDESRSLRQCLEDAFALIENHASGEAKVHPGRAADLLAQTAAIARLNELLGGHTDIKVPALGAVDLATHSVRRKADPPAKYGSLLSTFPASLKRSKLPNSAEVSSLIATWYSNRLKQGLPVDHAILKYTCQRLILAKLSRRALTLIADVYESAVVQGDKGVMFDLELMQTWLKLAYNLRSIAHCLKVFLAILEKGTEIQLTGQFMLLAKMTVYKTQSHRFSLGSYKERSEGRELEWMMDRLRQRFWYQKGRLQPRATWEYEGLLEKDDPKQLHLRP